MPRGLVGIDPGGADGALFLRLVAVLAAAAGCRGPFPSYAPVRLWVQEAAMDRLRTPFFVAALALVLAAVLLEVGDQALLARWLPDDATDAQLNKYAGTSGVSTDLLKQYRDKAADGKPPGFGVPSQALLDGLVLFTAGLMGLGLLLPETVQGKTQGIVTLVVSLLVLLAAVAMIFLALQAVLLMLALIVSAPFGTIAYMVLFGFFGRPRAAAVLGLVMACKLGFAVCLVLAHQRFLQNKGLVLIVLTSLLATLIVGFLHGFVPLFLVSITDAVAAIIVGILAALWAIFLLIGSLISVVKVVV